jgi:hypothetical protein
MNDFGAIVAAFTGARHVTFHSLDIQVKSDEGYFPLE